MNQDDPLNPRGRFKDLLRANSAGSSPVKMRKAQLEQKAIKEIARGMGRNQLHHAAWDHALSRNRHDMGFDDLYAVNENCPFRFQLHTGNKDKTGLVQGVGAYLDGFPSKLMKGYEEWFEYTAKANPSSIAVLVFKLPFLKGNIAVMHEGNEGDMGLQRLAKLVYILDGIHYTIQSAYSFGQATKHLW